MVQKQNYKRKKVKQSPESAKAIYDPSPNKYARQAQEAGKPV